MATNTFQGKMRTYGGQDKSSGVTPAVLTVSEVIAFDPTNTTVTVAVKVGTSTASTAKDFVLPAGAVPISFTSLGGATGGTSPTADIGSGADGDGFFNEVDVDTKGTVTGANGALSVGTGITGNTTVTAIAGSSAATGGTCVGIFTYTIADSGVESN
jgi:hypothetical protein